MRGTCTIVVPAYNAAAFVGEALDSIATQRRPATEFIVVDDGSPDDTAKVVEAWITAHPHCNGRLIRSASNRGLCHTRNLAIASATTDYVATLDADDILEPNHLDDLLGPLDEEPGLVLSFGDTREFNDHGQAEVTLLERLGNRLHRLPAEDRGRYRILRQGLFQSLLPGSYIPVSGTAFRRVTAIAAGLYDQRLRRVEDRDFLLRMAGEGPFAFVPRQVCRKRLHSSNISGPNHHLAMAEGAFGALMRTRAWLRQGNSDDFAATQAQLGIAASQYLYSASISGLPALRAAAGDLMRAGFPRSRPAAEGLDSFGLVHARASANRVSDGRPTLLCVATFPANTGFAWTFIEGLYARVADRVASRGIKTLVAYPRIASPPATLRGSTAIPITLSLTPMTVAETFRLFRTIRAERVGIIYFTDRPTRHWTYPLLRLAGVRRLVVHDHTSGTRSTPGGFRSALKWIAARIPYYNADLVIAVSDFVARRQRQVTLTPPGRLRRIWNGVQLPSLDGPVERCGVETGRPIILCAGRATAEKGIDVLLRAFDAIPRTNAPAPVLVYAGDGPDLPSLRELAASRRYADDIRILGYRTDVEALTRGADLCVVPSVWEDAFPLAVMQAMAAGRTVVGTRVGGIPEMIPSADYGRLVAPGDHRELANAIGELLGNPAELRAIGGRARARVAEHFTPDAQLDALDAALFPTG